MTDTKVTDTRGIIHEQIQKVPEGTKFYYAKRLHIKLAPGIKCYAGGDAEWDGVDLITGKPIMLNFGEVVELVNKVEINVVN